MREALTCIARAGKAVRIRKPDSATGEQTMSQCPIMTTAAGVPVGDN
jgi:hypothetical protein